MLLGRVTSKNQNEKENPLRQHKNANAIMHSPTSTSACYSSIPIKKLKFFFAPIDGA